MDSNFATRSDSSSVVALARVSSFVVVDKYTTINNNI